MSWLSRVVVQSMLRIDTVTLVNLVAESRTIPEFIGTACRPAPVAAALTALMEDAGARHRQLEAMTLAMARLGRGRRATRPPRRAIGAGGAFRR